jgi:hypothetical protein
MKPTLFDEEAEAMRASNRDAYHRIAHLMNAIHPPSHNGDRHGMVSNKLRPQHPNYVGAVVHLPRSPRPTHAHRQVLRRDVPDDSGERNGISDRIAFVLVLIGMIAGFVVSLL